MLLVATSAVLGLNLTETEMPQRLAAGITEITTNRIAVLMIINVFLLLSAWCCTALRRSS